MIVIVRKISVKIIVCGVRILYVVITDIEKIDWTYLKEIIMKLLTIIAIICFSTNLLAQSTFQLPFTSTIKADADKVDLEDPMYTISSISVTEVETPYVYRGLEDKATLGEIAIAIDKLIAIGKKVWAIIEKNKPVVSTDFAQAISVIPQVDGQNDPMTTFTMMSNWSIPRAKTYRVVYKNGFGMNVIQFDYTVMFQYGGQFDGKGNYLTGVTVFAGNIAVSWGFSFSAKSSLVNISNRGSMIDPVAGATLKIDYKSDTVVRSISSSQRFHVTGLGEISQIQ